MDSSGIAETQFFVPLSHLFTCEELQVHVLTLNKIYCYVNYWLDLCDQVQMLVFQICHIGVSNLSPVVFNI